MMASSRAEPLGSVVWPPSLISAGRFCRRHIGRDPETRAGANSKHRAAGSAAAAELAQILACEIGQRPGDRLEIVDQVDAGETEAGAQRGRIDHPVIVGQLAAFAAHHARHGKQCAADGGIVLQLEIGGECILEARIFFNAQTPDRAEHAVAQHRKARIGAADIAEQNALRHDLCLLA